MKAPRCCKKFMDLKAIGCRLVKWDVFFQCKVCGKVQAVERWESINNNYNRELKKEDRG